MGEVILSTGAAGYIGSMLLDALSPLDWVERIVGVDLRGVPPRHAGNPKLSWIQIDVADDGWVEALRCDQPIDAIVHCAYRIREPYGASAQEAQRRGNVEGARNVFSFAFETPSVRRLVHLSTVSAYGARASNSLGSPLAEDASLAERDYRYGAQKAEIEALLSGLFAGSDGHVHVTILRLASVSGPFGRFGLDRYGLVSTLAGRFPVVPCGRADWCRQYLHEDDLTDLVCTLLRAAPRQGLEVFNAAPDDQLTARDLARLLGKRSVSVPPAVVRALFSLLWHERGAQYRPPREHGVSSAIRFGSTAHA